MIHIQLTTPAKGQLSPSMPTSTLPRILRAALLSLAATSAALAQSVVYSNWPAPVNTGPNQPLLGNTWSYSLTGNQTYEVGDRIQLAGTDRWVVGGRFLLSSWNVSSLPQGDANFPAPFDMDWVLRFYATDTSGPTPAQGAFLGQTTVTVSVPYRPTPWPNSGILFEATFDNSANPIFVTDDVIVTFGKANWPTTNPLEAPVNVGLQINSSETVTGFNVDHSDFWLRQTGSFNPLNPAPRDSGVPGDSYSPYIELIAAATPEPSAWPLIAGTLALGLAATRRRSRQA